MHHGGITSTVSDAKGHGGHGSFTCPTISGADQSVCSTNWSGYADSNSGVTIVSGTWVVPSVTCPSSGSTYVAIWVGIDGYSSSTVEQTGTLAQCVNGVASYSAWYEFYPSASVTIASFKATPGTTITASVTSTGGSSFSMTIQNGAQTYTATGTLSNAARSSAEWIVERPALCTAFHCTLTTLSNFGTASFSAASATINGATGSISDAGFTSVAITTVGSSSGPILAQPSSLSGSGDSFSVAYV
jgi:Peptidase A4 family